MAWKSTHVPVTDAAAVPLFGADTDNKAGQSIAVKNIGATTVYIGGSDVTAANGYPLAAGEPLGADVANNRERGYARCATGVAGTLAVLQVGA